MSVILRSMNVIIFFTSSTLVRLSHALVTPMPVPTSSLLRSVSRPKSRLPSSSHHPNDGPFLSTTPSSLDLAMTFFNEFHHENNLMQSRLSSTALYNRSGSRSGRSRRRRRRNPAHRYDDDDIYSNECFLPEDKEDLDHLGLAKSVDEEYAAEEAKLDLTFWQVLEREQNRPDEQISAKSKNMSAWDRTKRRMTYRKGDVESKYTLMGTRFYGTEELLDKDHMNQPPTLDDLNHPPDEFKNTYWSQPLFRVSVVAAAYFSFPLWCRVFAKFETVDPEQFNTVVGQIAPNVGVLYATILALTLQVLYARFTRIQESATTEATLLSQIARNLLSLFANDREWAIEACQMVANQVRIMISRTRGVELLSIMKADTYSNILALVDDYHYLNGCNDSFTAQQESVVSMLRSELAQISEVRALRLSDEASSLPPTHFLLITSLSFVSIVAYVTASLAVVDDLNSPPEEASLLFAGLFALYVLFFNFCRDLNGPFKGVYQIKRSNAVSHLLQTKWLIVSQLGDDVTFASDYTYAGEKMEDGKKKREEVSFLDKVKSFFSGSEVENIDAVEKEVYATLINEIEGTSDEPVAEKVEPISTNNEIYVKDEGSVDENLHAMIQQSIPEGVQMEDKILEAEDSREITQPATQSLELQEDYNVESVDLDRDDDVEYIDFDEDVDVEDIALDKKNDVTHSLFDEEDAMMEEFMDVPEEIIEDISDQSSKRINVKKKDDEMKRKVDAASYFRSTSGFSK